MRSVLHSRREISWRRLTRGESSTNANQDLHSHTAVIDSSLFLIHRVDMPTSLGSPNIHHSVSLNVHK